VLGCATTEQSKLYNNVDKVINAKFV